MRMSRVIASPTLDEEDAADDEDHPDQPARRHRLLRVPDPAVVVEDHRRDHLPRDDRRHQGRGPESRREDHRRIDVRRAEEAADPVPEWDPRDRLPAGEGDTESEIEAEEGDRPDDEGDERREHRVPDADPELGVDPRLDRERDPDQDGAEQEREHRTLTGGRRMERSADRGSMPPRSSLGHWSG